MTAWQRAIRGTKHDWRLHLLSVFSVAVAFICLVSALVVVANVHALSTRWSHEGRASVYLQPNASAEDVEAIVVALRTSPGVVSVQHVTSAAAREELLASGDEVLASLPVEAFPASLEVRVRDEAGRELLPRLAERLRFLPAIEAVETYQGWAERLRAVLNAALVAAGILASVVLAAVVSVVASTIRLSLSRRRIEVQVLKVVGATDDYVRRPFVIEGALQGALGALAALTVVVVLFLVIHHQLDSELSLLLGSAPRFLPWPLVLGVLTLGTSLGAAAAHLSLRKMLRT